MEQREEGEVPPDLKEQVTELDAQVRSLSGTMLVLSEELAQIKAGLANIAQQQRSTRQVPSTQAIADLTSRVDELAATLQEKDEQLAEVRATAAAAQQALAEAGLANAAAAKGMQDAATKGAQAYMEQQQLKDMQQQQQREITELKSSCAAKDSQVSAMRTELGQLRQRVGVEASQVEIAAFAPVDMSPDTVKQCLAAAMGVSTNVIVGVERKWAPQTPSSSGGNSGPAAAAAAGSSGAAAAAAAGNSGAAAAAAAAGSSSSGAAAAAGSSRQPLALYVVRLSSGRYLHCALGGKCRMALRSRQLPIWVDKLLSEEERAERRKLAPLARQLRRDGVRVRWQGAELQQQFGRAAGRKQWQKVNPLPPGSGEAGADRAVDGGAGDGQ